MAIASPNPDVRRALFFAQLSQIMYASQLAQEATKLGVQVVDVLEPEAAISTKVALVMRGDEPVIAFRGTPKCAPSDEAWEQLVRAWKYNTDIFGEGASASTLCESFRGLIHRGFCELLKGLWTQLLQALTAVQTERPIWLTGHSQGGALAVLTAGRLMDQGRRIAAVYTFGCPRVGDAAFVDTYKPVVFRYENADDIVPLLPPGGLVRDLFNGLLAMSTDEARPPLQLGPTNFKHVGRLQFVHWDGILHRDASGMDWSRILRLTRAATDGQLFSKLWQDHAMERYVTALIRNIDPMPGAAIRDDRAEQVRALNDRIKKAYQQALAPNPSPSPQLLVDTMEALGEFGIGDQESYGLLVSIAEVRTDHLDGQLRSDWDYIRQAALWTIGMLNAGIGASSPASAMPGVVLLASILSDSRSYPADVACAAVQSLQVLNRPGDPTVQSLLNSASRSPHADVRALAAKALAGELIAEPPELVAKRAAASQLAPAERLEKIQAFNAQIRQAFGEAVNPSLGAIQRLVDSLEQLAVLGVGDQDSYHMLTSIAQTRTTELDGSLRTDWEYIRQASLWTIGMLNANLDATVPISEMPGIRVVASISSHTEDYPSDVACAAVQSLQVLNRSADLTVRSLLFSASKSQHSEVRQLVAKALAGEVITAASCSKPSTLR